MKIEGIVWIGRRQFLSTTEVLYGYKTSKGFYSNSFMDSIDASDVVDMEEYFGGKKLYESSSSKEAIPGHLRTEVYATGRLHGQRGVSDGGAIEMEKDY